MLLVEKQLEESVSVVSYVVHNAVECERGTPGIAEERGKGRDTACMVRVEINREARPEGGEGVGNTAPSAAYVSEQPRSFSDVLDEWKLKAIIFGGAKRCR